MPSDLRLRETPVGLWFQVEAQVRPLRKEEFPVSGAVEDDRMVVYAEETVGHMVRASWRGMYPPLAAPGLAADFMRLFGGAGRPRAERIQEFYAAYGPLQETTVIAGQKVPAWVAHLAPEHRGSLSAEARLLLCEPLWRVRHRAREVRLTYDLYRALRADDPQVLHALLPGVPEGMRLDRLEIEDGHIAPYVAEQEPKRTGRRRAGSAAVEQRDDHISPERLRRPLTDEECRWWGRRLLAQQLTWGESRAEMRWYLEDPLGESSRHPEVASGVPGLVRARAFPDLTTAIYIQLSHLVSRGRLYQLCPGCGGPFYPKDGRQKYCDPRCGDAARQRLFYRQPGQTGERNPKGKATR